MNVNFSVVDGCSKRHGTTTFLHFPDVNRTKEYLLHKIERDEEEEYCAIIGDGVVVGGGPITVFNVNTGEVATIVWASGTKDYVGRLSAQPADIRMNTIADTTFIVNRLVPTGTIDLDGSESTGLDPNKMPVQMRRTSATPGALTFEITKVEWKERGYYQQILSSTGTSGTFKLGYLGDSVCMKADASDDSDDDDWAHPYAHHLTAEATAEEVQHYLVGNGFWPPQEGTTEDLPSIEGLSTLSYGKVQCIGGPLHLKEIVINISQDLDVTDMIVPVQSSVGGLKISRGSNVNNPAPKFATEEKAIRDIAFHKNRLVLAADEYLNFSKVDDLFLFYTEVADNLVDSDAIEVQLASEEVTVVESILPFRKSVLVFTTTGRQFELDQSSDILSPSTATLTASTAYETQKVRPVAIGDRVFMLGKHKEYGIVYEYYYDDTIVSNRAIDVTKHVFDLVPPVAIALTGSSTADMVLVMPEDEAQMISGDSFISDVAGTDGSPMAWHNVSSWVTGPDDATPQYYDDIQIANGAFVEFTEYGVAAPIDPKSNLEASSVYTYRQYLEGKEKKQSAWARWTFGSSLDADFVLDAKMCDNELFILRRDDQQGVAGTSKSGLFIERMSVTDERDTTLDNYPYEVCLDHKLELEGVGLLNSTTWKLQAKKWSDASGGLLLGDIKDRSIDNGSLRIVLSNDFGVNKGRVLTEGVQDDGSVITISNNDTGSANPQEYATIVWDTSGDGPGGNYNGHQILVGRSVDMTVELSKVLFRPEGSKAPVTEGRCMLQKVNVDHLYSGPYTIRSDTTRGFGQAAETQSRTQEVNPPGYSNTLGDPAGVFTEDFGVGSHWIHGNTMDTKLFIESSSPVPVTISSCEYHGVHGRIRGVKQ
ncbi:MAG: hypothetical protein CL902_03340 [Dehalococcoidia bacterium]|nr:hypothetical protein [Dehalococcoidia bacterium]